MSLFRELVFVALISQLKPSIIMIDRPDGTLPIAPVVSNNVQRRSGRLYGNQASLNVMMYVLCVYCAAMAFERSGWRAGCRATTCFSWSKVMNTIPVAIRQMAHTVTALFMNSCFLISTAP